MLVKVDVERIQQERQQKRTLESIVIVDDTVDVSLEAVEDFTSEPAAEDIVDPEVEVETFSDVADFDEVVPEG